MSQIHLVKLCVGAANLSELLGWEKERGDISYIHTRNMPKRSAELLQGGSLYWVIKGVILCRRKIVSIIPVKDSPVPLCHIGLSTQHFATEPHPRRAFQGWRYLEAKDTPRDINEGEGGGLPLSLMTALKEVGAW